MGSKKHKKEGGVKNPNAPKQTLKNKKKAAANAAAADTAAKKTGGTKQTNKQTNVIVKDQESK